MKIDMKDAELILEQVWSVNDETAARPTLTGALDDDQREAFARLWDKSPPPPAWDQVRFRKGLVGDG